MAQEHTEIGAGKLSIILTAIVSIWTSLAMEVSHGILTLAFLLLSYTALFFWKRYLHKNYPTEENKEEKE
jgi:membrane protein implicated in regulation of membrane protease activity